MSYFYLINSLPEGGQPGLTAELEIESIQAFIFENLNAEDARTFCYFLYRNDNKNLLNILRQQSEDTPARSNRFHRPAVFSHQQLEEGINGLIKLPAYIEAFLEEQRKASNAAVGRNRENRLIELYYEEGLSLKNHYARHYFSWKQKLKNIISLLNARQFNLQPADVVVGDSDFTAMLLRIPAATRLESALGSDYAFVETLRDCIEKRDYIGLEKTIDRVLIEQMEDFLPIADTFSADHVFHYFLQLAVSARWLPLQAESGRQRLSELIDRVLQHAGNLDPESFSPMNPQNRPAAAAG